MPDPIPVILAPYDPEWPALATRHAESLQVLGPTLQVVHHIGSTAVPGLAAKPIIDLMPLVTSLTDLDRDRGRVESLGYAWHGAFGIQGRRYCTLADTNGTRAVQLHFFEAHSQQIRRHLAFRDYLRAHPAVAAVYENEKRRARDLHPDNSLAYNDAKGPWIQRTEAEALVWFAEQ